MANPNIYKITPEIADEIIDRISQGQLTQAAVAAVGVGWATYVKARQRDPELFRRHLQARITASHDTLDTVLEVVRSEPDARRAAVIADATMRYVRMVNPRDYGDKLDLTLEDKPSVRAAIELARRRVSQRPGRDLRLADDSQPVDATYYLPAEPTDSQSGTVDSAQDELAELMAGI